MLWHTLFPRDKVESKQWMFCRSELKISGQQKPATSVSTVKHIKPINKIVCHIFRNRHFSMSIVYYLLKRNTEYVALCTHWLSQDRGQTWPWPWFHFKVIWPQFFQWPLSAKCAIFCTMFFLSLKFKIHVIFLWILKYFSCWMVIPAKQKFHRIRLRIRCAITLKHFLLFFSPTR